MTRIFIIYTLCARLLTIFSFISIPHASPPTALNTATSPSSVPGAHGSSPIRDSPLVSTGPSPLNTDVSNTSSEGHSSIDPSTSPTSSYPIHYGELHSSPLNPNVSSSSSSSEDTPTPESGTEEGAIPKPKPMNIPGYKPHPLSQAASLPNSSTPASGAEADTEMA